MKKGSGLYWSIFLVSSSALVQRITNFLRARKPSTIFGMSRCSSGSPPAIETTGAPHSSIASMHWSTDRRWFRISSG